MFINYSDAGNVETRICLEPGAFDKDELWLILRNGETSVGVRMTSAMLEKLDADISAWMMEHAEGFEEYVKEQTR